MALDDLEVERQVGDGAEPRKADDETDRARDGEDPVAEELQRHDRLAALASTSTKAARTTTPSTISSTIWLDCHDHVAPPRLVKSTIDDRPPARSGAEVVELVADVRRPGVERGADHGQGEPADLQVDVEDPAAGQVVHEEAAEQRPQHGRHAEDGAEDALVLAAVARRDDVAPHGHGRDDQAAAADALHRTKRDQLEHALGEPAERRADEENHDRRLQDDLAPVEVAELPVDRPDDRRRE